VGDILSVTVRNNARFPFSFAAHQAGVSKQAEGVSYLEESRRPAFWSFDDALPPLSLGVADCGNPNTFLSWALPTMPAARVQPRPGVANPDPKNMQDKCGDFEVKSAEARTYKWRVDDDAAPGPNDPSSILFLYSSHVGGEGVVRRAGGYDGFGADTAAGLVGPIIVTRKGHAAGEEARPNAGDDDDGSDNNEDAAPKDVDKELVVLLAVHDENESPYLRHNIWHKITKPAIGTYKPGHVPFGPTTKAGALQGLYAKANRAGDKLSYADAEAAIAAADAAETYVGTVRGVELHVWFDASAFDPRWFDATNGGTGTALQVLRAAAPPSPTSLRPACTPSTPTPPPHPSHTRTHTHTASSPSRPPASPGGPRCWRTCGWSRSTSTSPPSASRTRCTR
jgi:hypothetical protein